MYVKRADNLLWGGGVTKVSVEGGTKNFGIGWTCLDLGGGGVYPFMGMVPLSTHIPDIGQPWSNLLLDSQSFGQGGVVIGVSDNVLLCYFCNYPQ